MSNYKWDTTGNHVRRYRWIGAGARENWYIDPSTGQWVDQLTREHFQDFGRLKRLPFLYNVGINDDGSLHNPNGYPEDLVRAAVLAVPPRPAKYYRDVEYPLTEDLLASDDPALNNCHSIRISKRYMREGRAPLDKIRLCNIGTNRDGTLFNPNRYPEGLVRAAMVYRQKEIAAQQAATRKSRHEKKVYEIVEGLRLGKKYGPADRCVCCKKDLTDEPSVARGIGPECWQDILQRLERRQAEIAGPPLRQEASEVRVQHSDAAAEKRFMDWLDH